MNSTPFLSNNIADSLGDCDDFGSVGLRRRNETEDSTRSTVRRVDPLPDEERIMIEHISYAKSQLSVRELASSLLNTTHEGVSLENGSSIRRRRNRDNKGVICSETVRGLEDMGLPESILERLRSNWIDPLTQIQIKGLSVAMSGRDMLGISFTGSGCTLMSVLPLVTVGLQEECFMPISRKEGPFGLILCPCAELATHTFQLVQEFTATLKENKQAELRPLLCVDGKDTKLELEMAQKGVHIIVATPGRLNHMLANETINLDSCRYLALDKADLLFDARFEHDIQSILGRFKGLRQTLLFCANITADIQNFAKNGLVKPVAVNAGLSYLTENVEAITIDDV